MNVDGTTSDSGISVVVIAKNEAQNIRRCLGSITASDDVVVVDDHSQDETREIAAELDARVVPHVFESFAEQRNWALDHAGLRHEWVLMLDADEALTAEIEAEIRSAIAAATPEVAGFLLCRRNWFLNRFLRHADGFPVWIMRLVHRDRARFVDSGHGEVPAPPVDGQLRKIKTPFLHYPFSHGLSQWVARHNEYSTREAELEFRGPPAWSFRDIVCGPGPDRRRSVRNLARRLPFRPLLRFLHHYVWKLGFLDGRAGLAFSQLMAGYEALIVLKGGERKAKSGKRRAKSGGR